MLMLISPAKTLDFESPAITKQHTLPEYLQHSKQLVERMRQYSALDIADAMDVSMKIAELNVERFSRWCLPFTADNAKQALLAFKGEVYSGLQAEDFTGKDLAYAQKHLRILSGLYGLLRPLDLMQPYRLEMGRKIKTDRGSNLYEFWGEIISDALNKQMQESQSKCVVNLASIEYFKSVKPKLLKNKIITPQFKEFKNGEFKMIGVYAKKARGLLSRYAIKHKLTNVEDLKSFNDEAYLFNQKMSNANTWVFTRRQS
ncbi:MAG: peroxide stress protein YaaA [Gammaproteobacteria bacterium]|nr:peroxide stress protein YaaA [Gammaproteobacteria bacterium]MDH5727599.1 peroxide stress protein YaaA [Gammaproteobacteria bacterium]